MALSADSLDARSKETANSDMGNDFSRHIGSNPKENLQMLSKENLLKTSCKSKTMAFVWLVIRRGMSRCWIS